LLKNKKQGGKMEEKVEKEKKCFSCGRPATRNLFNPIDGSTVSICDLYPYCNRFPQKKEKTGETNV